MAQFPSTSSGSGSTRVVYASSIPGVVLDCDLDSGAKVGGGSPTDNSVLGAAIATNPMQLVLDGGAAMATPLMIPSTGSATVSGIGWGSGLFVLGGSNCTAIQNFPHTQLAEYLIWNPRTPPQSIAGKNVTLSNFRIVGNRGTYTLGGTTGNANGAIDHTLDGYSATGLQLPATYSASAKGSYDGSYWLTGITLVGLENLKIEDLWIYDAPAYGISLYHCHKVQISGLRIESPNTTAGTNTDGVHINGGCADVTIQSCWFRTGDDAIAFNLDEGDRVAGVNFVARDITLSGCLAAARVHGQTIGTDLVTLSDFRGSVQWYGLIIGNATGTGATDLNGSILMDRWTVDVTAPSAGGGIALIRASVGLLEMRSIKAVKPTAAHPFITLGADDPGPTASTVRVSGLEVHRNSSGSAAVNLLTGLSGTISNLVIAGYSVTDNGSFSAIPYLINLTGTSAITRIWVEAVDMTHVTAFCNDFTKIGSIAGPGCAGLSLPDASMANGWPYLSSDHSNAPAIKVGGVAKLFTVS